MPEMKTHREIGDDMVMVLESKKHVFADMVMEALKERDIPVLLKSPTGYYLRGMFPMDQDFFNLRLYVHREYETIASDIVKIIVPPEEIL
jgi:hypothetical protein